MSRLVPVPKAKGPECENVDQSRHLVIEAVIPLPRTLTQGADLRRLAIQTASYRRPGNP